MILSCYRRPTSTVNKILTLSRDSGTGGGGGGGTSGPLVISRARGSASFKGKIVPDSISTDQKGRILSVIVEINDTMFQVCNICCPTHRAECSEFIDNVLSYIKGSTP